MNSRSFLEEIEFFFPKMHITRSYILKNDVVPMHVHNRNYGFVYVLSGKCKIANYAIESQQGDEFLIKMIDEKIYGADDFTLVTQKNNIHSFEALEDTTFLDAFSVADPKENIQDFIKVTEKDPSTGVMRAKIIELAAANIPQHLLDKVCKEVIIK